MDCFVFRFAFSAVTVSECSTKLWIFVCYQSARRSGDRVRIWKISRMICLYSERLVVFPAFHCHQPGRAADPVFFQPEHSISCTANCDLVFFQQRIHKDFQCINSSTPGVSMSGSSTKPLLIIMECSRGNAFWKVSIWERLQRLPLMQTGALLYCIQYQKVSILTLPLLKSFRTRGSTVNSWTR